MEKDKKKVGKCKFLSSEAKSFTEEQTLHTESHRPLYYSPHRHLLTTTSCDTSKVSDRQTLFLSMKRKLHLAGFVSTWKDMLFAPLHATGPLINMFWNKCLEIQFGDNSLCSRSVVPSFPPTALNVLNKHHHPPGHPCYWWSCRERSIPYPNEETIPEGYISCSQQQN